MPSTKVSVSVPLCGSTISQMPTSSVSSAQITRTATDPTEWAENAAAKRIPLTTTSSQPMKIAVPTEATAGTRIAMTPSTTALAPTNSSAFQLRLSPSRTSGSSDAPPRSMGEDGRALGGRRGDRLRPRRARTSYSAARRPLAGACGGGAAVGPAPSEAGALSGGPVDSGLPLPLGGASVAGPPAGGPFGSEPAGAAGVGGGFEGSASAAGAAGAGAAPAPPPPSGDAAAPDVPTAPLRTPGEASIATGNEERSPWAWPR